MEKRWLCSAKDSSVWVHRTVRWCTGQCLMRQAGVCQLAALRKQSTTYNYKSPDCPVVHWTVRWCTGLSGEPTVGQANGRLHDLRETRGRANGREGAPDCPVRQRLQGCQRSASPNKERNPHRTVSGGAGSSELVALGNSSATYGYNSRDCPVCTGLSGEPTVDRANGRPHDLRGTRGRANG